MVNAQDGYHLWSETYDRELADVFEIQDEIARSITQALRVKLAGGDDATLVKEATSDPVAYQLYLQGLYRISRLDDNAGIALFEQAIARDPQFAPAHAALASAIGERPALDRRSSVREAMETSRRAAERALALDSLLADAHVALGEVRYRYDWDFQGAEESFLRAIQLNPNHSGAYYNRGNVLLLLGRLDEALALARRAVEVDPINPLNACVETWALLYARRYQEALARLQAARRQHEIGCGEAWSETFYMLGRYRDALAEARTFFQLNWSPSEAALLIEMADQVLGASIRGEQPSPESVQRVDRSGIRMQRLHLAKWYTWAGDHDAALQVIEEMVAERDPFAVWATYSYFDPLRSDPRYRALIAKMGLR